MQKTFSLYPQSLIEGAVFDDSLNQIDTFAAEEAITFGQPVMLGTLTDQVTAGTSPLRGTPQIVSVVPSDGTKFIGIALNSAITPIGSTLAADANQSYTTLITQVEGTYSIGSPLRVAKVGRICVNIDTVTAASNQVWYSTAGAYIVNPTAPANSILIGTALWNVTATGLCVVQVNKLI